MIEFPKQLFTRYPIDVINKLTLLGFPPHELRIKLGCCIMFLRNLDASQSDCNGLRYIVNAAGNHVIAVIATGTHIGNQLFIPRICSTPSDNLFPFTMHRKQFPIRLVFSFTANKSQGQTLRRMGIYLLKQVLPWPTVCSNVTSGEWESLRTSNFV